MQLHRQIGSHFILNNQAFDTLYSVLLNFGSIEEELQMRIWEFMIKGILFIMIRNKLKASKKIVR